MRWVVDIVRPHAPCLVFVVLLSLVSTTLGLTQPYITKYLIDDGLIGGEFPLLLKLSLLMLGVALASAALGAWNRWYYVDVSARVLLALREHVYGHLLRLSPRYFAGVRGGDLIARLDGDVAEVQRFAVDSMLAFVNGTMALVGALVLMFMLSARLSVLALVLIPAIIVFLRYMRPRVTSMTRTVRERASDITSFLVETLGAMKFIQSVGAEDREAARLSGLQDVFRQDTLRLQMTNYVTATVPGLLTTASTVSVFVLGGYWTIRGDLSVGTLIAFSAYLVRATGPVHTLLGLYVAVQRARVSLERIAEVRDARREVTERETGARSTSHLKGNLRFDNVSFAYEAQDPVLRNATFEIPAGSKVAVRGASGAGKSTLVDLLQRHYDPGNGAIFLDGISLKEFSLSELRRRVSVVAQDTVLLSGSILDNVRYANPAAPDAAVRDALARAAVDEFAAELPQGLNASVGARGASLSGGQRQRVAIARALLQDPLLLILDEATSGVEPDVECRIVAAIDELFPDRTRLNITHRPLASQHYDWLMELAGDGTVRVTGRLS